jgi:hypothetical protein
MPKTDKEKASVDTSTAKPMYKVTAEAIQGLEPIITVETEYERLYGWIHKGDVDATLKAILKELVRIRMGGGHV